MTRVLLGVVVALWAVPVLAQDRPSEEEMFGAPAPRPGAAPSSPTRVMPVFPTSPSLGKETSGERSSEMTPEDPLKIGGQFYMRAAMSANDEDPPSRWTVAAPTLVDGYFDARPNERVRGFLLARLRYDPTLPEISSTATSSLMASSKPLELTLDQLWLSFDVMHSVFITAGRQHVKWGTGHFWNPTDFLHQVRRDPLASLDARTGTTMVKLQLPWEKYGWNLYSVGILESLEPNGTMGKVGGALRAEMVLGPAEIGVDAIAQRGIKPKIGLDFSSGLGPIDVYGEAALSRATGASQWRTASSLNPAAGPQGAFESFQPQGTIVQATGGVSWSFNYSDVNVLTLGAEYFYNSIGYEDTAIYPWLLSKSAYQSFYVGKHYAGVYGTFTGPSSLHNLSATLSNVANLSDHSYVTRVDCGVLVLTHLQIEAYGAVHYGNRRGEFRLALDTPDFHQAAQVAEFGLGLRIKI